MPLLSEQDRKIVVPFLVFSIISSVLWFLMLRWANHRGADSFLPKVLTTRDKQGLFISLLIGVLTSFRYTLTIKEAK